MFDHIADLAANQTGFAHKAFKVTLSQIGSQRIADLLFVFVDCSQQLFKHGNAEAYAKRRTALKVGTLLFQNLVHILTPIRNHVIELL